MLTVQFILELMELGPTLRNAVVDFLPCAPRCQGLLQSQSQSRPSSSRSDLFASICSIRFLFSQMQPQPCVQSLRRQSLQHHLDLLQRIANQEQIVCVSQVLQIFVASDVDAAVLGVPCPLHSGNDPLKNCIKQGWANWVSLFCTSRNRERSAFLVCDDSACLVAVQFFQNGNVRSRNLLFLESLPKIKVFDRVERLF